MSEDRLLQMETMLAYQDDLLTTLNKMVADQQERIEKLEKDNRDLNTALKDVGEAMIAANIIDEKPPHY